MEAIGRGLKEEEGVDNGLEVFGESVFGEGEGEKILVLDFMEDLLFLLLIFHIIRIILNKIA